MNDIPEYIFQQQQTRQSLKLNQYENQVSNQNILELTSNFYNQLLLQQINMQSNSPALINLTQSILFLTKSNRIQVIYTMLTPLIDVGIQDKQNLFKLQHSFIILIYLLSLEQNQIYSKKYFTYTLEKVKQILSQISNYTKQLQNIQKSSLLAQKKLQNNFLTKFYRNMRIDNQVLKNEQFFLQVFYCFLLEFLHSDKNQKHQFIHIEKVLALVNQVCKFAFQKKISKFQVLNVSRSISILSYSENKFRLLKKIYFQNIENLLYKLQNVKQNQKMFNWSQMMRNIDFSLECLKIYLTQNIQKQINNSNNKICQILKAKLENLQSKYFKKDVRSQNEKKKRKQILLLEVFKQIKNTLSFKKREGVYKPLKHSQKQLVKLIQIENLNFKQQIVQSYFKVFERNDQLFILSDYFIKIINSYDQANEKWKIKSNSKFIFQQQKKRLQGDGLKYSLKLKKEIKQVLHQIFQQQKKQVEQLSSIQIQKNQLNKDSGSHNSIISMNTNYKVQSQINMNQNPIRNESDQVQTDVKKNQLSKNLKKDNLSQINKKLIRKSKLSSNTRQEKSKQKLKMSQKQKKKRQIENNNIIYLKLQTKKSREKQLGPKITHIKRNLSKEIDRKKEKESSKPKINMKNTIQINQKNKKWDQPQSERNKGYNSKNKISKQKKCKEQTPRVRGSKT